MNWGIGDAAEELVHPASCLFPPLVLGNKWSRELRESPVKELQDTDFSIVSNWTKRGNTGG